MLSTSIDFPLFWPIFDRRHEIVASCHVRRGLGDQMPALLKSSAQKKKKKEREILSWKIVVRTCLWLINLLLCSSVFLPSCIQSGCSCWAESQRRNAALVSLFLSLSFFLFFPSSCVIRPRSDPTCPDVPPHPPSCPSVSRTLTYRWWRAACRLAWAAVWFSEDTAEPPGPRGWAEGTVHYSFTFTFIRILFRLPLIYGPPLTRCNNKNILSRFLFTWVGLGPLT